MTDGALPGSARPEPAAATDPVLVRRAQMARLARTAKRIGYGLFALAVVLFVAGAATRFTPAITTGVTTGLVAGSIVLVPAIILGYGVRGAERDERIGRAPGRGAFRGPAAPSTRKAPAERRADHRGGTRP